MEHKITLKYKESDRTKIFLFLILIFRIILYLIQHLFAFYNIQSFIAIYL